MLANDQYLQPPLNEDEALNILIELIIKHASATQTDVDKLRQTVEQAPQRINFMVNSYREIVADIVLAKLRAVEFSLENAREDIDIHSAIHAEAEINAFSSPAAIDLDEAFRQSLAAGGVLADIRAKKQIERASLLADLRQLELATIILKHAAQQKIGTIRTSFNPLESFAHPTAE